MALPPPQPRLYRRQPSPPAEQRERGDAEPQLATFPPLLRGNAAVKEKAHAHHLYGSAANAAVVTRQKVCVSTPVELLVLV
jgi:hypothetical protein